VNLRGSIRARQTIREPLLGPANDLGQRRGGARAADRLVSRLPPPVEPDPAEMAARYGAEMTVPDWHKRLVCGQCGSRRGRHGRHRDRSRAMSRCAPTGGA
jgi:hypothetical protein